MFCVLWLSVIFASFISKNKWTKLHNLPKKIKKQIKWKIFVLSIVAWEIYINFIIFFLLFSTFGWSGILSLFTWIQEGEMAHNFISKRKYTLIALNFYFTGEKKDQRPTYDSRIKCHTSEWRTLAQSRRFRWKKKCELKKRRINKCRRRFLAEMDRYSLSLETQATIKRIDLLISSGVSIIVKPFAGSGPIPLLKLVFWFSLRVLQVIKWIWTATHSISVATLAFLL